MRYPKVNTPFYLSFPKSKFEYSIKPKPSTSEYLVQKSSVPLKYFGTLFIAYQCTSQGFCINIERIPTEIEIFDLVVVRYIRLSLCFSNEPYD